MNARKTLTVALALALVFVLGGFAQATERHIDEMIYPTAVQPDFDGKANRNGECAEGQFVTEVSGTNYCRSCPEGFTYNPDTKWCLECPEGRYLHLKPLFKGTRAGVCLNYRDREETE